MNSRIKDSILKALSYADVFDYPLTYEQIGRWAIGMRIRNYESGIKNNKLFSEKNGYYFLRERDNIVKERIKRKKWSEEKFKLAEKTAKSLRVIPTVKLIGITGALAVENAKKEDDIDLIIITSKGFLWTTRLLVTFLLEIIGNRRHPQDLNVNNKICLNMFVCEDYLTVSNKEQDIFSAHEVLQMNPIFNRDNTYQKFLMANQWVGKYLPNAFEKQNKGLRTRNIEQKKGILQIFKFIVLSSLLVVRIIEGLMKRLQLWYMQKRRTTEIITDRLIRFHPHDSRKRVLNKYSHNLKQLHVE